MVGGAIPGAKERAGFRGGNRDRTLGLSGKVEVPPIRRASGSIHGLTKNADTDDWWSVGGLSDADPVYRCRLACSSFAVMA